MDEDICDSSKIRLFKSVPETTLRWNVMKWWIVYILDGFIYEPK